MSEVVNNNQNTYEHVNHPAHYNNYDVEVIDMIKRIWGVEQTILWCEMTAFKYRMRMGTKPGNTIEQDLKKEKWYLDKKKELLNEFENEVADMVAYECSQYLPPTITVQEESKKDNFTQSATITKDVDFFTNVAPEQVQVEYIINKN